MRVMSSTYETVTIGEWMIGSFVALSEMVEVE